MKNLRSTLVAAGAAAGMTLAGLGVASAQTSDAPSTTENPPAESVQPAPERGPGMRGGRHGGHGKGMGIHGEFVTRAPEGGYQTVATQVGEVTQSSASSLTVRSEDGYTRTYVINDDTGVASENNGIADVHPGDQVHVKGIVTGDTATAKSVHEARPKPAQPAAQAS